MLAWEHERFGIRRLPAFTLSHLPSHRLAQRSSIMDVRSVSPSSRHGAGEPPAGWVHYWKFLTCLKKSVSIAATSHFHSCPWCCVHPFHVAQCITFNSIVHICCCHFSFSPFLHREFDCFPYDWAFCKKKSLSVCTHVLVSYRPHVGVKKLSRNTKVVAEALARVIYNLTEKVTTQDGRPTLDPIHALHLWFDICCFFNTKGAPGDLQIFTEQMVSYRSLWKAFEYLRLALVPKISQRLLYHSCWVLGIVDISNQFHNK